MKKKIVVGSIAVILLILGVSFTSSVGISIVKSDSTCSPLFEIRRKGITDEKNQEFEREYIGKQKTTTIPLPSINDTSEFLEKYVQILNRMDETTYERFLDLFSYQLALHNVNLDTEDISTFFNQLRNTDEKNPIPPTVYTCWIHMPFNCFLDLISLFIQVSVLLSFYMVRCLMTTAPTIR